MDCDSILLRELSRQRSLKCPGRISRLIRAGIVATFLLFKALTHLIITSYQMAFLTIRLTEFNSSQNC